VFDSLGILIVWKVWLQPNARIFRNGSLVVVGYGSLAVVGLVDIIWFDCDIWS
jgi:hypothetical protein